jgi:methionyl-tRNA formyltransferase
MRVVFMGTPDFAVPTLERLIKEHTVVAVVTQPDKPKGRGNKVTYMPVKEVALEHNIPVLQPIKIKEKEAVEEIRKYAPEVIVVVAFGQIISKELLDMPKYGCINVHGSLLPKYRGSGPIQWSIINGDAVTGATTMLMDIGCDTGDMLLKCELAIDSDDTYETLYDKMKVAGADLLIETLEKLQQGNIKPIKQNNEEATHAPMLKKEMGQIDWNNTSVSIVNLIRGLNPWPSAYTSYNGEVIKIWKAEKADKNYNASAGVIVDFIKNNGIVVKTGDGAIIVSEVQAQGGKRMSVTDYMRGHSIGLGETFI